jgi:hypothetical protein
VGRRVLPGLEFVRHDCPCALGNPLRGHNQGLAQTADRQRFLNHKFGICSQGPCDPGNPLHAWRLGRGMVLSASAARMGPGSGSFGARGRIARTGCRVLPGLGFVRQCHVFWPRMRILRERLARGGLRPRDLAPLRRLASARASLTGTAARRAAPSFDMAGFLTEVGAGGWGDEVPAYGREAAV